MSTFQPNWNLSRIPNWNLSRIPSASITLDIVQIVDGGPDIQI
jgi:hypothetical protein